MLCGNQSAKLELKGNMALRTIVKTGDPLLRQKSREVEAFDGRLSALLDDMAETMNKEQGLGIAAVQVGILRRAALVKSGDTLYELINPVIIKEEGLLRDSEGCLSVPNQKGEVERSKTVTVKAYDRKGESKEYTVHDYTARAFLHEIDHMNGVLFTDKMIAPEKKGLFKRKRG